MWSFYECEQFIKQYVTQIEYQKHVLNKKTVLSQVFQIKKYIREIIVDTYDNC